MWNLNLKSGPYASFLGCFNICGVFTTLNFATKFQTIHSLNKQYCQNNLLIKYIVKNISEIWSQNVEVFSIKVLSLSHKNNNYYFVINNQLNKYKLY